ATVSNDTGPAHLSIALGTPTVVILGGGHFGSFFPYPDTIALDHVRFIYEKMPCYHCFWRCHKRASKFEVFPCISAVNEERVTDSVLELIQ
ncbi:MAG TPA: glycosyltransferase family 9 protein, partial [Rhodospirillales bacterium]|nr:glycosyltransferase family 9 protein [Rhodospirillales bacterium]